MGFFIELILECIGDIGIGLARLDKQKRRELFAEAKRRTSGRSWRGGRRIKA